MPDNPATPGSDPMCMEANAMEWTHAWVAHKPPPVGKEGMMYMLKGGTVGIAALSAWSEWFSHRLRA